MKLRFAAFAGSLLAAFSLLSCGSDDEQPALVGVWEASQSLQAGNTSAIRWWFGSNGTWGRTYRQTVGGAAVDTCATAADTGYTITGNKVALRNGSTSVDKTWSTEEGGAVLRLDPAETHPNGTPANAYKRVTTSNPNRTCTTAFSD